MNFIFPTAPSLRRPLAITFVVLFRFVSCLVLFFAKLRPSDSSAGMSDALISLLPQYVAGAPRYVAEAPRYVAETPTPGK